MHIYRRVLFTFVSALFAICILAPSQAEAFSLTPSDSQGSAWLLPSLQTPTLGDHRQIARSLPVFSSIKLSLGMMATPDDNGSSDGGFMGMAVIVALFYVMGVAVVAASSITTIIGNSVALSRERGRLGWGIASVIVGSLSALAGLGALSIEENVGGSLMLGLGSVSLILGIVSIIRYSRNKELRYVAEKPGVKVLPWVNVGHRQSLQGGFALVGRF